MVLAIAVYEIDVRIFPKVPLNDGAPGIASLLSRISQVDALFCEGIIFVILGILDFLAYGGMSYSGRRVGVQLAKAKGVFGDRVSVSASEMMRKDKWEKLGLMSVGSVAIITGVILLVIYFVSL
jgi:hypothetical protein